MIDYQEKHQVVAGVDATGGYSSGDKKTLDIGEILTHSQTLNTASQSLTSICDNMYNTIISLEENESFKSKFASAGYYEKFNTLNGQVPKFTEGVLKFSKFLSDYLIGNYQDTDDEMKSLIEATLNDSLSQLAAIGVLGGTVDMTKISATAQGAISGEGWIKSDKINTEAFSDTGNLEFITREDGAVMITRNGVPIGFTTEEALKPNESAATSVNTTNEDFMNNQMMRNNPDMAKANQLASNTEGMGNNEAIIKARENGTLNSAGRPETPLTEGMGNNEAITKARENGTLNNVTQYTESQKKYMENQDNLISSYKQNDNKLGAAMVENEINTQTNQILSGNGGLASEIIKKGEIEIPADKTLVFPGIGTRNWYFDKNYAAQNKVIARYNDTTSKIDLIKTPLGTNEEIVMDSYDVDKFVDAYSKQ